MAGFVCHDASNIPLKGYASAAWLTVAEAYPCTEYSGSGTEPSTNQPLQKHKHQITVNYPFFCTFNVIF